MSDKESQVGRIDVCGMLNMFVFLCVFFLSYILVVGVINMILF